MITFRTMSRCAVSLVAVLVVSCSGRSIAVPDSQPHTCPALLTSCDGDCVDVLLNPDNCGSCGTI
jgi:hypothetical protein